MEGGERMMGSDIRRRVCLQCPHRDGTQDDPDYPLTFCKGWLATCSHGRERITEAFQVQETEDTIIIPDLDVKIPKKVVEEYINHIVDRLRGRMVDEWEREKLLWRVRELEETRRNLHLAVKREMRAKPYAVGTGVIVLETLIEQYVETRAKRFA